MNLRDMNDWKFPFQKQDLDILLNSFDDGRVYDGKEVKDEIYEVFETLWNTR